MNEFQSSILCLIDFSETSVRTLHRAVADAMHCAVPLTILYPYRLKNYQNGEKTIELRGRLEHEANQLFDDLKFKLPELSKVNHKFSVEVGFTVDRIDAYIHQYPTHTIVVGGNFVYNFEQQTEWGEFLNKIKTPITIVP